MAFDLMTMIQGIGGGLAGDPLRGLKIQQAKEALQRQFEEMQMKKEKHTLMAEKLKHDIKMQDYLMKYKEKEEKVPEWLGQETKDVPVQTEGPPQTVETPIMGTESDLGPSGEPTQSRSFNLGTLTKELPPPMGTKSVQTGRPKIDWSKGVPTKDIPSAIKLQELLEKGRGIKPQTQFGKYAVEFGLDPKEVTPDQFITLKGIKDKWEGKIDKEDIFTFHTTDDEGNVTAHIVNKKTKVGESIELGPYGAAKKPVAEVNVTTNVGGKSMVEIGTQMGKQLVEQRKDVLQARQSLWELGDAEKLISSPIITGYGAEYIVSFGKALQQIGFNVGKTEVANTEAYISLMGKQVGQIIKQFGAGTGLSDADREYAEKISGGKVTLNKDSIKKIISINKKGLRNVISTYNKTAREVMAKPGASDLPYDLTVEMGEDNKKENLREKYGY